MREPGIDTFNIFNLFPNNFDETIIRKIADQKASLTSFLKDEFHQKPLFKNSGIHMI
ncbi:MAG: hypothetical protein QT03_C0001G0359 [archaeon GW2011_AR10]|nr:MAG: hypothetical protein QT03_C0001G0359 [archaeon GW2011_AR10]